MKGVLAIDPGSSKCGMVLVRQNSTDRLELIWRAVVPTEELETTIDHAQGIEEFSMVVIGNGTRSKDVVERVREHIPGVGLLIVDEKDTSVEARARYWEEHKRTGWRRLIPSSMQTPPEPYDDFAALVLAERVLVD